MIFQDSYSRFLEEEGIVRDVKEGTIENIEQLLDRFEEINANYRDYQWAWTYPDDLRLLRHQ